MLLFAIYIKNIKICIIESILLSTSSLNKILLMISLKMVGQ